MKRFRIIALLVPLLAAAAGLAQNRVASAPTAAGTTGTEIRNATGGAMQDRSSRTPAEALFVEKCGMCHRQMGMGTVILARRLDAKVAMLEARDDLTADYVMQAARAGIGNMPRISRGEVSDAQMAAIARYLAKGRP